MLIEVKVPQLSESVSEATLVTWHKKEGDAVSRDENLIDIETDKVVLETPAPGDGVIVKIVKGDGETVASGELIAQIDTEAKGASGKKDEAPADDGKKEKAAPAPAASSSASASGSASPAARKILEEKGMSADEVSGSGRGGRVTKQDAVSAEKREAQAEPAASTAGTSATSRSIERDAADRPEERVPMTRLRARIAERLIQSKNENAILTTFNEVNMAPVIELRKKYGERFEKAHGVRLGFMGFFVKAVVAALKKYPIVNASVDGNDIVYHGYIDVGIAVGSPRGLVVPIIRDADLLSIADIEKKIGEFGAKAKDGKLTMEELTGGTISISNGGVFGSMLSTPIINPPQSAILGIHATKDRPVVENGEIVIRPINYLALSYDHRIIDGREAVLSLVAIKEALEDPARLILDL
ncbi:2-oxoglutarate dehydrogenase complex dihydrolipoyllysine-residue succinyltransferase [Pseudazoarcus pumilus]|uniref:Dihydrolipoyllysine-residue succinyltransferase component of 2-oxoglutarate dehydrogenase complex n=1 Tax=Pseudazoarcus pumilus TaxID=2067960 RepID=A0A2I6S787_9RHOO|nr:2-oxoglutarate dehydrogenase complex dihydrolipoyllysine-residue succinyltransferase [Pseudazoarcus pumilus]AUN95127.1 dihydrolipoyllysine-residue succinyltransferase [Pseudazoarcus pumilus]